MLSRLEQIRARRLKPELLHGFYLGELLIEPVKQQVSGRNYSMRLSSSAAEVLLQLATTPNTLVSREFLLEKVWGEGRGSATDLDSAVDEIVTALRDSSDNPQFIQTLPDRGYRLIANLRIAEDHESSSLLRAVGGSAVEDLGILQNLHQRGVLEAGVVYLFLGWLVIQIVDVIFDQLLVPQWVGTFVTVLVIAGFPIALVLAWYLEFRDGKAVLDTGPHMRNVRPRSRRTQVSILGAFSIAAILVFTYDQFVGLPGEVVQEASPPVSEVNILPVEPNSIAVLKFLNLDGSEQTEIFASGFAEEMINRLSRLPTMSVASRGDAWSLGSESSSVDVRRRLRVAYYVEGSVRSAGESLAVNVRLIDSTTGFQVASKNFDEPVENFNQVQKEIINVTVANLRIVLPPETQDILASMSDEADLDAYILYRRGKDLYEQPRTIDNVSSAIGFYEQALVLDSGYAAAHAGLCAAYGELYYLSSSPGDIVSSEAECAAALASNPRLHMVYTALGDLYASTRPHQRGRRRLFQGVGNQFAGCAGNARPGSVVQALTALCRR